jgi:hypothetical protein
MEKIGNIKKEKPDVYRPFDTKTKLLRQGNFETEMTFIFKGEVKKVKAVATSEERSFQKAHAMFLKSIGNISRKSLDEDSD